MNVNNCNIVTAPGDSDPLVRAAVGGSGVKAGSNVAGSLRSSSSDREGVRVASQAPATLPTTSADETVPVGILAVSSDQCSKMSALGSVKVLKNSLAMQDWGYKLLLQRAKTLEQWSAKVRNPEVKTAMEAILTVISGMRKIRDEVIKAFKNVYEQVSNSDHLQTTPQKMAQTLETTTHDAGNRRTPTAEKATDTPCWWQTTLDPSPGPSVIPAAEWQQLQQQQQKKKKKQQRRQQQQQHRA